jgi:hypothetical protein
MLHTRVQAHPGVAGLNPLRWGGMQRSMLDTSNFDSEFTDQKAVDSLTEGSELSASVQRKFEGFTFVADANLKSYAATPQLGSSLLNN